MKKNRILTILVFLLCISLFAFVACNVTSGTNDDSASTGSVIVSESTSSSDAEDNSSDGSVDDSSSSSETEDNSSDGSVDDSSSSSEPQTLTVTFDSLGGSAVAEQIVEMGALLEEPEDPMKTDSFFDGWYLSVETGAARWNFATDTVSENLTLYAKWIETDYLADGLTVRTTEGYLRGSRQVSTYSFLGVKYAEATERFTKAEKIEPWKGVKDATTLGLQSIQSAILGMQPSAPTSQNSNACQNLNIYTPAINDGGKRAVMVWLHGGGFSTGTANQNDGTQLAAGQNVVVVGVNHRLGLFGFLDLTQFGEKYSDSANVGMWDVIDALTWIKNNIANFGGDPDNVTVFGQSGGGAKVLTLMSSPYAKGLFKKAIVQSGATEYNGVYFINKSISTSLTNRILRTLNVTAGNIESLQNMDAMTLLNASVNALSQTAAEYNLPNPLGAGNSLEWEPCVDGDFLPTDPVINGGTFAEAGKDIPLLIGSNLTEWGQMGGFASTQYEAQFRAAYPNETASSRVYVDTLIRLPMLKIALHKADQSGAAVYSYVYTNSSSNHGAEVSSVFGMVNTTLGRAVCEYWANFAKNGVPAANNAPEWGAYTRERGATMILDDATIRLAYHHDKELLTLAEPEYMADLFPQTSEDPEDPEDPEVLLPRIYIATENAIAIDDSSLIDPDHRKGLFNDIPVYNYVNATVTVEGSNGYDFSELKAQVKVRGNYSSSYEKKPIRIKFDKKQTMCGLNGEEKFKNWVLLAEYRDSSMLRNSVAFFLGKELLEGEGVYASDFCFVEVYLNNAYYGLFVLAEQQEAKSGRVDLPKAVDPADYPDPTPEEQAAIDNVKIGYFIEYDGYYTQEDELERFAVDYYPAMTGISAGANNTPIRLLNNNRMNPSQYGRVPGFVIKSDVYTTAQRDFIARCVQSIWNVVLNATYVNHSNLSANPYYTMDEDGNYVVDRTITSAQEAVGKVIDLDSLYTMYILQELLADSDLSWSSFFFSIDMSEGGAHKLVYTAPWDFDSAIGISTTASGNSAFYAMNTSNPWLVVFARQSWFWNGVRVKWNAATEKGVFDRMFEMIDNNTRNYVEAFARNFSRWPNSIGRIQQNSRHVAEVATFRTQADASAYMRNWLLARVTNLGNLIASQT